MKTVKIFDFLLVRRHKEHKFGGTKNLLYRIKKELVCYVWNLLTSSIYLMFLQVAAVSGNKDLAELIRNFRDNDIGMLFLIRFLVVTLVGSFNDI